MHPSPAAPSPGLGGQRLPVVHSRNHTHSTRTVKRKSLLQHQQRLALGVPIISHQHDTTGGREDGERSLVGLVNREPVLKYRG